MTSEDREHAKRIVYSVVYGAGEYTPPPSVNWTIDLHCFIMTKYLGADSDLQLVNCVRRVNVLAELIIQKYNTDTDK